MQSDFYDYDSKKTLLKLQQMYHNFFRFFVIQHKKKFALKNSYLLEKLKFYRRLIFEQYEMTIKPI